MVVAAWGALSTTTIAAAGPTGPAVEVDPDRAVVGDVVTVTGRGHPDLCTTGRMRTVVQFDGVDVANVREVRAGEFTIEVEVPERPPGTIEVRTACRIGTLDGIVADGLAVRLAGTDLVVEGAAETPSHPSSPSGPVGDLTGAPSPGQSVDPSSTPDPAPPGGELSRSAPADVGTRTDPSPLVDRVTSPSVARPTNAGSDPASDLDRPGATVVSWVNDRLTLEALPGRVLDSAVLSGLFVVLVGFPAALFDATIRRHYDRLVERATAGRVWVERIRAGVSALPDRLSLLGAAVVGATVSLAIDPAVARDADTLWFGVGLAVAFALLGGVGWLPAKRWAISRGRAGRWRAYPNALLIVVACVAVSRGLGIAPGYLYGLLFAYHVAGAMDRADDAFTYLRGFQLVLALAVVAWVVWVVAGPFGSGAIGIILDTAVTTLVIGGVQGTLFALAPWRGTPGWAVRSEFPKAWSTLAASASACFVLLLVDPGADIFDMASGSTLLVSVLAFCGFCAVSFGTWWRLTLRPQPRASVRA